MNNKIMPVPQQVLAGVVFLTVLSGGCSVWLSSQESLSPQQIYVFETSNITWKMGVNVIFGLLGSNAIGLLQAENKKE